MNSRALSDLMSGNICRAQGLASLWPFEPGTGEPEAQITRSSTFYCSQSPLTGGAEKEKLSLKLSAPGLTDQARLSPSHPPKSGRPTRPKGVSEQFPSKALREKRAMTMTCVLGVALVGGRGQQIALCWRGKWRAASQARLRVRNGTSLAQLGPRHLAHFGFYVGSCVWSRSWSMICRTSSRMEGPRSTCRDSRELA